MSEEARAVARRGRPRNVERRRLILGAALAAFAQRGYEGATVREIATEVGIREALLYRYYASKSALLDAVVDEELASANAVARQLRATASRRPRPPLPEFLRALATLIAEFVDNTLESFAVGFTGLPIEHRMAELRTAYDAVLDAVADGVRNSTPSRDPSVIARVLGFRSRCSSSFNVAWAPSRRAPRRSRFSSTR